MDRRGLFKRLGVAAVAVAVGAPTLPAASETDAIRTLVEDVLAHPGKHPEIMADARRLMGGVSRVTFWRWRKDNCYGLGEIDVIHVTARSSDTYLDQILEAMKQRAEIRTEIGQ